MASKVQTGFNSGPRLEFVVRKLRGTVKRRRHVVDKDKKLISTILVEEPAGFMLYLPNGNAYRLSPEELTRRGYDRESNVINFEQINDKNTPAGMYKFGRNDAIRERGWRLMEDEIIKNCVRRAGPMHVRDDTLVDQTENIGVEPIYDDVLDDGDPAAVTSKGKPSRKVKEHEHAASA